jgi:hypothetical protein
VNALYSQELYEAALARLNEGGVIAQWVPFHLLSPPDAVAVSMTFPHEAHQRTSLAYEASAQRRPRLESIGLEGLERYSSGIEQH